MTLIAKTAEPEPDEAVVRRVCAAALRAEVPHGWEAVVIVKATGSVRVAREALKGRLQVITDARLNVPALWRTVRGSL